MRDIDFIKVLWPNYFPKVDFVACDPLIAVIDLFYDFFKTSKGNSILNSYQAIPQRENVAIDVDSLRKSVDLLDFQETLLNRPNEIIGAISIAVSIINFEMLNYHRSNQSLSMGQQSNNGDITMSSLFHMNCIYTSNLVPLSLQLRCVRPIVSFDRLKSDSLGKLVSVIGYITRISHSHHMISEAQFYCPKCERPCTVYFEDGVFSPPSMCPTEK